MDNEKIGAFIRELREEKNISQYKMADELFISRSLVAKWENGKVELTSSNLKMLCEYFDVSPEELLSGERIGTKKRFSVINILKIAACFVFLLLCCFLLKYFVMSYNSIMVYKVNGTGTYATINNAFLLKTRECIIFNFHVVNDSHLIDNNIKKFKLYYKIDDNSNIIFEGVILDSSIKDTLDEQKYFDFESFSKIIDNLYLEVSYDNNESENIKLDYILEYKNNNLF